MDQRQQNVATDFDPQQDGRPIETFEELRILRLQRHRNLSFFAGFGLILCGLALAAIRDEGFIAKPQGLRILGCMGVGALLVGLVAPALERRARDAWKSLVDKFDWQGAPPSMVHFPWESPVVQKREGILPELLARILDKRTERVFTGVDGDREYFFEFVMGPKNISDRAVVVYPFSRDANTYAPAVQTMVDTLIAQSVPIGVLSKRYRCTHYPRAQLLGFGAFESL